MPSMYSALPPLITALLDPGRYPHLAERVDVIETHASWVLLAGAFAYKIKKPVTLPFLDYGSVARREMYCHAELSLNQRLAPDLYLDVLPIGGTPDQPLFGALPAIEWAVRMKRFDENGRLDRVASRGGLKPAHLSQLAATLCAFQAGAAIADPRFGAPDQVLAAARENFTELRQLLPQPMQTEVEQLARWTEEEFARRRETMDERRASGRVRECHGDLHLGNLVLIGGEITPFDCIEFNEEFRWIDVASEMAFLWVDLLDHGQPGLAAWLLSAWLEIGGDFQALQVFRFHAVYRAMVRAKVAALSCKPGAGLDGAREYLELAWRIAVPPAPTLLITCGVSGSGKTTASSARLLDFSSTASGCIVRLRSDIERKRLFGLDALQASGSGPGGGIYTAEATLRTYERLLQLARQTLLAGWPVIVDAAFLRRAERQSFHALADELGVGFGILHTDAPVEELRRRIRSRSGDASEATVAVLDKQLGWFEPLSESELLCAVSNA